MDRREAILLTLLTAFLWGTSFPAVSLGLESGLNPVSFVFLRFGVASIPMLFLSIARGKDMMSIVSNKYLLVLGIINTFSFILQFEGQVHATASLSALLVNMSALVAAAGSALFLGETFGKVKTAAVSIALVGVFFLTTNGNITITREETFSSLLLGMTAVSWGAYVIVDKKMLEKRRVDALGMTTWIVLLTCIFTAPMLLFYGFTPPLNPVSWGTVLYTALLNTALPYAIYQAGLERLSATISSIILLVEPVVAIVFSSLILGERMNVVQLAGATMILCSIFMVSFSEGRRD